MTKIYFYPKIELKPSDTKNSYVIDFENAISVHHEVINKETTPYGVFDLLKHFLKTDIYIFNWIEDLPRRRYGKPQVLFFMIFLLMAKGCRKKIIWVLHNKYSHNLKKNRWTDHMFNMMMKNADLILTHSNEGIKFVKENYPKYVQKIKYIIHPIKEKLKQTTIDKKYDFLFWGTIHPYKDIVKFLRFVKERGDIYSPKILIVGRCNDENYKKQLRSCLSANIIYDDTFYEMEEIGVFASQSKYILFTYSSQSVLSSGALLDSIRMGTHIIGPNHGAFKDLSNLPTVNVYNSYDDIIQIFKNKIKSNISNKQELEMFFEENSWTKFANRFKILTEGLYL